MDEMTWPSWMYGPNGASGIFQSAAEVPEGWVDSPAKVGAELPKKKGKAEPKAPDADA